jgi:hypothetical protein
VVVVIVTPVVTVIVKETVPERPLASVAVTTTEYAPTVVGVPEIVPELNVRPLGKELPDAATQFHVYGAVAPLAVKVVEYGTPTPPTGTDVGVILTLWFSMAITRPPR